MQRNPRADHASLDKILRRERFTDFAFTLARVNWQFFLTHTYSNPLPKGCVRGAMFWRWCRDVSEFSEVPYKDLLIALRCERGEIGGRPHLHSLVGGLTSCNMMAVRSQMIRAWKRVANNGHLDCRLYDRSLAGADYLCKCLGANAYELSKFTIADETTLSHSVFSVIRNMDASGERRCCELIRKNRQVANWSGSAQVSPDRSSIQHTTASVTVHGLSQPSPSNYKTLGV